MRTRILLAVITIIVLCSSCDAFQDWLHSKSSATNEKRSMASALLDYLDYLFPKDDVESRMLKWVFTVMTDNESLISEMTELMS